jgi:hypothetical protein
MGMRQTKKSLSSSMNRVLVEREGKV